MKIKLFTILFLTVLSFTAFAHVDLEYPKGNETFSSGETITIKWKIAIAHNTNNWDIYFSSDNGQNWETIKEDINVNNLSYVWTLPQIKTSTAKIRVVQDNQGTNYDSTSDAFIIQIAEPFQVKIITTYRYPSGVLATENERSFFEQHSGLYLMIPVTPWHRNTRGMIYFTEFLDINLMNGYSGKSTDLWDSIMNAEMSNGALSKAVVDIASANGCDYIVVSKMRIHKYSYNRHIKPLNLEVVFNNDRFVVLSL